MGQVPFKGVHGEERVRGLVVLAKEGRGLGFERVCSTFL